jgi:SPP1 family predicted phage head-tail adaptor
MRAGELRHRVSLQSPTYTRDDGGQTLLSGWTTEATYWARVESFAGREYEDDAAVTSETQLRITLRWPLGETLGSDWRLLFGSRVLQIDSVTNLDERDRTAVLVCREIAA